MTDKLKPQPKPPAGVVIEQLPPDWQDDKGKDIKLEEHE